MKPTPKFAVGEEVGVHCHSIPDIPRTEVTSVKWYNKFGLRFATYSEPEYVKGWVYQVTAEPGRFAKEEQLFKLPPEDRTSWEDCEWQPNKIEEEEQDELY